MFIKKVKLIFEVQLGRQTKKNAISVVTKGSRNCEKKSAKSFNLWEFLRGFKNKYFLKKFEPFLLPFFCNFFLPQKR